MKDRSDQRKYERILTERPVKLFINDTTLDAKMIDISIKGAGVLSKQICTDEKELQLEFHLPSMGAENLKLDAKVIHKANVRGECLMGLEFDPQNAAGENAIDEYIHYRHRQLR